MKSSIGKKVKIASLVTSFIVMFNIFPVGIVSADEAISISTVSDFKNFTEKCVYDEYSRNKKFVLQNDIDLKNTEIKPIEIFCGIFEGNGHSIKNVNLSFEGSNKGLFCNVTRDGQIRDLTVTGEIKVTNDTDAESIIKQRATSILSKTNLDIEDIDTSAKIAGGIVGYNEGKIINSSFSGSIDASQQAGGIVGYNAMSGLIDTCSNEGEISGDSEIGGIAGYNEGRIKLSKNSGKICPDSNENTKNVGGISGNNKGALVICTNEGEVGGESFGDNIGGISGMQSGEIRECINKGLIRGRRSIGGISGRFEPYTDIDLSYESAKAAIRKQADIFQDDVDSARKKIIDYGVDLLTGSKTFSSILSELGFSDSISKADKIADSAINMMDSISRAVDSASDANLSGSATDAVNQFKDTIKESGDSLSSFSEDARTSIKNSSDSLNKTLDSFNDFLDEFDGKGKEISDLMDNLNDAVDQGRDDIGEISDKLTNRLDSMKESVDKVTDNLDETHENLQSLMNELKRASKVTSGSLSDVADNLDVLLINLRNDINSFSKNIDKIKTALENIINGIKPKTSGVVTTQSVATTAPSKTPAPTATPNVGYKASTEDTISNNYDVEPTTIGSIADFLFPTAYAADDDDDMKTAIENIKSTDISLPRLIGGEQADTALIKYSFNEGTIEATEYAGGIAGNIGFESIIRSGDNVTLPDGTKVSSDSVLKAVIDSCISEGKIVAKNKYAGGISGKCDIGNIKNSLTTGEINVTEGDYAGGTVGMSSGSIEQCIAINDLYGKNHIGGIAGTAKDIVGSYSLPRLDEKIERSGAIAGFITGNAEHSYFIDEGLTGIDGVSLEGKAEAVKPYDMTTSDGSFPEKMSGLPQDEYYMESNDLFLPQIKSLAQNNAENIGALLQSKSSELSRFRFNVVFKDKDQELKSLSVDYGTVLKESDIPKLSADGKELPIWDKDVEKPIIRHTTFTTIYNKATTTISSGEDPAILLAESVFTDDTSLTLKEEDVTHSFSGYEIGKAYSFTLNKPAYDVIKVHIRDENKKAAKIGIQQDGKWSVVDCSIDGSYAVFETDSPCRFVILYNPTSPFAIILIIIGILAASAAGVVIFRKVRKKNAGSKEENI